jgi:hypothetical protein
MSFESTKVTKVTEVTKLTAVTQAGLVLPFVIFGFLVTFVLDL